MKRKPFKHIIISRTDSIGDVILTLPLAGLLKEKYPGCKITFLGSAYTRSVVALSSHIDAFLDWDAIRPLVLKDQVERFRTLGADLIIHVFPQRIIGCIAKKAGIPLRLGTTNRWFHWINCNRLVPLSRRRSPLHESQLNMKLIRSLTGKADISLDDMSQYYGFKDPEPPGQDLERLFDPKRFNLIMHPRSKGSAREWGLENFKRLVNLLPSDDFKIFVTGTKEEGTAIRRSSIFKENPDVVDLTGKLTLQELIRVIYRADGLLAASTGPLHIAAALGKHAVGIYPPIRPMHPGRWAPVGRNASYLVKEKACSDCRKNMDCHCIREITPEQVSEHFAKIT
jgi:ADP-heptose:LPS heptosyltransferase